MKPVASFVLIIFLLANGQCSTTAEECDQNENMLAPGRWYQYGFDIRAEAASVGSTDDVSDMNLACRVRVSHIGSCKYLFQVQQCAFSSGGGPPGGKELWIEHDDLAELAKFPVVMSLSGGVVNGLNVSPTEPEHLLNIKRALISAFVLRKSHMTEGADLQRVDVHGTCPWKMWPGAEPGTAHSSKDMLYCAYPERPDWNLSPWAVMWNLHFIQYLINSTVECAYHASGSGNHLESLHCHERHAIKLESTHDTTTAVQTNVFYKMSLESQGVIESPSSDFGDLLDLVPAGIAFKHLPTPDPTLATFDGDEKSRLDGVTRDKLAELVVTAEMEIRIFTIPLFHEFVELLRKSNDLVDFVESVADCNHKPDDVDVGEKFCTGKWKTLAMSFLQDALIQSNTVPAMRAFRHLVARGHVSRAYLPLAFHSWSFLRNNDTRYLEEVFEICKSTEHKMCWLLVGRMIRKYHANNIDKNTVLPIFSTIIRHMSTVLGTKCDIDAVFYPPLYSKPQKIDHLIVMLKALKNAGTAAQLANPVLEQILLACAGNADLPIPVAVFAVEALQEFPLLAYDTLLAARELLGDRVRPWELRIAVYRFLTRGPDRWKLGKAVSSALGHEPRHSELVDYAVSDFLDSLPRELRTALQEGKFDTDSVIPGEKFYTSEQHYGGSTAGSGRPRKSGRRSYERRLRLPFMPPELSGFAVKVDSEEVFGGWRNLLSDLSRNVTLQLFGTEFHFADVTVFFKEIEQFVLSLAKLEDGEWRHDWDIFFDLLVPGGGASRLKRPLKHFPKLQSGLKKILDLMPPAGRMSLTPLVDLNMFGTDLTFSSYGEILVALASAFVPPEPLDQFLRQPRSFDVMRTIRIIEGYHQVPTMLGLPLNWTTSATLVASLRSEASYTGQGNFNFKLRPSGALTFLNRMLLDFPTKTRMGVQANSSAYTATRLSATANLQRESARLELHHPEGEQKILQLVRTNQLIKHDRFKEMGDWHVQRVNAHWCSGEALGRATGLQLCHDRSYANVTHLMRPWFLMAAPASWQLVLSPYSGEVSSVVIAAVIPSRHKQFRIDVCTKGAMEKTLLTLESQEDGGFVAFVPDAPYLRAAVTKGGVGEDTDASNAVVTEYALGYAPGQQVVLTYRDLSKEEKRQKPAKETNRFLNSEVMVGVRQRSLTLRSGTSSYGLSWNTNTQPTGVKQELRVNFEGGPDGGHGSWLRDVVADEFFTKDGSGGWAHLLYHRKSPTTVGRHKVVHSSHGHIATPKTVLDLTSYFLESGSRQLTQINLTKVEKETQRLLAFANYTQEHWRHAKGGVAKRSARYNLTVSHHSWALHFDEESRKSTAEVTGQIRLLNERMRRRQADWGFFSTWWHPSTSHLFEAELGQTELSWLTTPVRSSKRTPGKTALEATLRHRSGNDEPFSLQLLANVTLLPAGLEADWLLGSANSDLKWEAHSRIVGLAENGALPRELTCRHTVHHKGKPFGTYRLQVRSSDTPCLAWELRHNVTSEPWLYTSNVSYACDPLTHGTSAAKAYMNVTVFSASPVWELLDTDLNQVFELGLTGYESMNMTSGLGKVTVNGRWDADSFVKEAKFGNERMNWIPVELLYNLEKGSWILDAKYQPHSTSPAVQLISISKRSVRSGAATIYDAKLVTKQKVLDPYAREQSLFQAVVVPRESDTVVRALVNEPATHSLLTAAGATAARCMQAVGTALHDPGHPINRMLHPLVGTSLGQMANTQRHKAQDFLANVWTTSTEVLGTFHSVYEPVLYTGSGLFRKAAVASGLAEAAFRQTIPGWAFYYFHLDWVLAHTVSHAPQLSAKLAKICFTAPTEVAGITEVSAYVPRIPSYDHIRKHVEGIFQEHRAHSWTLPRLEQGQKVAAIFGAGHVITFDGVFLEFPSYPASYCTYLLAHDIGGRRFTLTTSAEDLLVDFPEATVAVLGQEGRVAVNGSDAPVHLPLVLGHVDVHREGHLVRIRGHGLTVYCDVVKFFCTFVLDQSLHGNVLGVLGNADGDSNNDYELPNGQMAPDAAQLARGYEMSGYAECRALVSPVRSSASGTEQCWQRVPQALKHCLAETRSEALFHEACAWDVSHGSGPCTSINAMVAYCAHHGYGVADNLHCDHCHDSAEAQGKKSFRLKSAPVLEVVVLLAESSFDPRVAPSVLAGTQSLVDAVDAVFKAWGHDTKYAFVLNGGGEGPHYRNPHLRTAAKDVFVPHVSAAGKLLRSIGSSGRSAATDLGVTLGYALDTVPFSAEAARVVLAIAADDFNCSRHELDRLHEKTQRSGVTLYAFSHYPTVDQRGRVFGVRADGLVFPESTAGEEYLDYPSRAGLLTKLAAATKGSAFQVQFIEAGLPAEFFEVVAQEVFAKVGKEAKGCRECTCDRGRAWGSLARCRPVGC